MGVRGNRERRRLIEKVEWTCPGRICKLSFRLDLKLRGGKSVKCLEEIVDYCSILCNHEVAWPEDDLPKLREP